MVENGYLYRSKDPKKWKWDEVGVVESVVETGKRDTIRIKLRDLQNKSVVFKASAQALDSDWVPKVMSPLDGTKSIYTQQSNIAWESISPYAKNGDKSLKLFANSDNLFIHLEQSAFPAHIQIYIDSDHNEQTGYRENEWNGFAPDYLVEDGYLYRYTGKGDWGWEFVDIVSKYRSEGDHAILDVTVPRNLLQNLADKIKVGVELNNEAWTDTEMLPERDIATYRLAASGSSLKIEISEVMAANSHTLLDPDYYNFSDWIELHNLDNKAADISGYQLSDKLNKPKWRFPEGTVIPADGYLLVWADEKDKKKNGLHTNFKLKMGGEAVALFDPNGKSVDAFSYLKQLPDISVAYKEGKEIYMNPTPGSANSAAYASAVLSQDVTFSLHEGFYNSAQTLSLSARNSGTIYYTTDGSIPTTASARYREPIAVDRSMTVRAISVEDGKFSSPVTTHSYIVGENTALPVIAISIDEKYLHYGTIGIYTVGTNGKKPKDCGDEFTQKANFLQKWERPAHMTFFETDKSAVLSQDIGLKVAGECSRIYAQKSLQLKSDDKYGKDKFSYKVFPDKEIKKYAKLKLRNAGQDYLKAHMRDILVTELVKNRLKVAYEAYRPTVVYVNGAYWGLYNLREKKGKDYIKENFGEKKFDLIEDDLVVEEGSSEDYEEEVIAYLQDHSLASDANYHYIASKIDIDNYIDYMITNIYIANADWPGTNLLYWKPKKEGAKWQWLLYDMDYSFGLHSENSASYNALEKAKSAEGEDAWPNPEWSTLFFRKLLENQGFKTTFKNRFLAQLDTTFAPDRVKRVIDAIAAQIDPEMARQIERWNAHDDLSYKVGSKDDWLEEIQVLKTFAEQRPAIVREHLNQL